MIFLFQSRWWMGGLLLLLLALAAGIFVFSGRDSAGAEEFVVEPADLTERVSVIGKVRASEKVDLAFKQSGFVVAVERGVGDRVAAGDVLARLDSRDAVQAVNDARAALERARVELAKLDDPSTSQAVTSRLNKARQDGLSVLARVFGEVGDIIDSVNHTFFDNDFSSSSVGGDNLSYYATVLASYNQQFRSVPIAALQQYNALKRDYDKLFSLYRQSDLRARFTDPAADEKLISDTYQVLKRLADLIKLGRDLVQYFHDRSVAGKWTSLQADLVAEQLSSLSAQLHTINTYVADLGAITSAISQERLSGSTNNFSQESQLLLVAEKENVLANTRAKLDDYVIRAPFAGILTKQEARVGEFASSGLPLISLITDGQLIVEAHVPEVDIAKIKLGDKASVTLDAYGEATKFEATVTAIDPAETVLEGVPTYKIRLIFVQADERIRSGMTANLELLTGRRTQVLAVPLRAIKFDGDRTTVLRRNANGEDEEIQVVTGLRASDGRVEIISGLDRGDRVVLK